MIDQSMIGVDASGEVKVWWNPSFHKNQFSNSVSTNIKLKDMILGIINCLAIRMSESEASVFRNNLMLVREINFTEMWKKVKEMHKGLDLKVVAKNMLAANAEVSSIFKRAQELTNNNSGTVSYTHLTLPTILLV